MLHDYNTRAKKNTEQDDLAKLELNIIKSISELKDEALNLKDMVIKNLKEENARLHFKCSYLEKKVVSLETKFNHLDQHGRGNSLVLSGIPDTVEDKDLESTVSSILSEIDVTVGPLDVEAGHRIGLSG